MVPTSHHELHPLYERGRGRFGTHSGDDGVNTEAEIRARQAQAKKCRQPPEPRRGKQLTPLEPVERLWSC